MADETHEAFVRGVEQFNRGDFFEAHEAWEAIWLNAAEPDKTFLQGITQVAAAFHHNRRGNSAGAESLLRRGVEKLELFRDDYRGIRLEALRAAARRWHAALVAGEHLPAGTEPQVEWGEPGK